MLPRSRNFAHDFFRRVKGFELPIRPNMLSKLRMSEQKKQPLKASLLLLLATVFWGVSFPVMKSIGLLQQRLLPDASNWFAPSLSMTLRFSFAAFILLLLSRQSTRTLTRLEIEQGVGIGFFNTFGIILQMDGLSHTSASTSAFLTQCYCVLIPIYVTIRERRWPSRTVSVSCALALAGVAILSQFNWRSVNLGRGELETVLASVFFTGQILWLNRPKFAWTNSVNTTLIMFLVTVLCALPITLFSAPGGGAIALLFHSRAFWGLMVVLTFVCTLLTFTTMNYWQPHLPETHAGLIYCAEPVFATLFALFLPSIFAAWAGINYANETMAGRLIAGGSLIIAANILLLVREASRRPD